ncbi:MAG: glycosyltransferase family 2 protein [Leptolyngbyaceae cyanobacterium]
MNTKLLTISIPTYNRSELLDKQLEWVINSIKGLEEFCEIIVSNNNSTDNTKDIIQKWKDLSGEADFKVYHNKENIGAIRNIANCIKMATSKHVWVMSDDDRIFDTTLEKVINLLKNSSDLGLLFLNYSTYNLETGISSQKGFPLEEKESSNGQALFEEVFTLKYGWGALIFTTALIYRTDLAQKAISEWETGVENLMFQLYITAFCALHGPMRVTKDTYLEYAHGRSFFIAKKYFIKMHYVDTVEVYLKMMQMGYSKQLCKRNILTIVREPQEWLIAIKLLIKRPLLTIKSVTSGFILALEALAI